MMLALDHHPQLKSVLTRDVVDLKVNLTSAQVSTKFPNHLPNLLWLLSLFISIIKIPQ